MIFVSSWCRFVSKCDVIMLFTCAFDCFFGVGAVNFTYLSFCVLNHPFSPLFQIIGWIIVVNQLGFNYFLDRVQGNRENTLFLFMGKYPYYLSDVDIDEMISILLSFIILLCNLWMASKLFTKRQL